MSKKKRPSVPCSCRCADGSPCGRRVVDQSQPPVCNLHRAQAAGNPHNSGHAIVAKDLDPMDVLQRDMRSAEASVRVRAATELLAEQRRRRPEREEVDNDDKAMAAFMAALTDEERAELTELTTLARFVKARVYDLLTTLRSAESFTSRC